MKKQIIIAGIIALIAGGCFGQANIKSKTNKNNMEEKLDIKWLKRKAEKTVYINGVIAYYLENKQRNGTIVIIEGDEENGFTESRIPKNSYYEIYKEYYPNGILKQKGSLLGEHTAIGMWYYYDELGNLSETVNEDRKFGKFGYMDVLDFLIKNNYVEKDTYKGIFKIRIVFSVEDLTWRIRATTAGYIINDYTIDGNTGEIKEHKIFQGGRM